MPQFAVFPTEPCCNRCTIRASTIQLFFWPTHQTTAPGNETFSATTVTESEKTFTDDSGFQWISPSIYIAFDAISATNLCGHVGSAVTSATMAFDPSEISSIVAPEKTVMCTFYRTSYIDGVASISSVIASTNGGLTSRLLAYSDVAQNCSTIEGYEWFPDHASIYDWSREAGGKFSFASVTTCATCHTSIVLRYDRSMPSHHSHPGQSSRIARCMEKL